LLSYKPKIKKTLSKEAKISNRIICKINPMVGIWNYKERNNRVQILKKFITIKPRSTIIRMKYTIKPKMMKQ
jgi:hypothetical protein